MTDPSTDLSRRRITVALDETRASLVAFDSAARLAHTLSAQVKAIFIQDQDVLSAARLPGFQVLSPVGGHRVPADEAALGRAFRLKAARIKSRVAAIAEQVGVSFEFETRRGPVTQELLREAETSTLFALGAASERHSEREVGSVAAELASQAHCALLVSRATSVSQRPVVVVAEPGSTAASMGSVLAQIVGAQLIHLHPKDIGAMSPERSHNLIGRILSEKPSLVAIERRILTSAGLGIREAVERLQLASLIVTDNGEERRAD